MNTSDFLTGIKHTGPCLAIASAESELPDIPEEFITRTVDGAQMRTLDGIYDEMGRAWHFPANFVRNQDAFNDWMRDFDNLIEVAFGLPPAPGFITIISNAELLLTEQPELIPWFIHVLNLYRDYYQNENGLYRAEGNKSAVFATIFRTTPDHLTTVRQRWQDAGADLVLLD